MSDRNTCGHDGTFEVPTVEAAVTNGLEGGTYAALAGLLVDASYLADAHLLGSLQLPNRSLFSLQSSIEDWALLHQLTLLWSRRLLVLRLDDHELSCQDVELNAHDYFIDGGRRCSILLC